MKNGSMHVRLLHRPRVLLSNGRGSRHERSFNFREAEASKLRSRDRMHSRGFVTAIRRTDRGAALTCLSSSGNAAVTAAAAMMTLVCNVKNVRR